MRKISRRSFLAGAALCGAAAALTACGGSSASSTAASSVAASSAAAGSAAAAGDSYTVGICQLVEHAALDAATQGFEDALSAEFGENVTFDFQNAQNDSATCATIANGFVSAGVDLIMANATPALQAAQAATNEIPILGTSVTEYGVALGLSLQQLAGALVRELRPSALLCVDSLCSSEPERLGRTLQFSDTGLCPAQPGSRKHLAAARLGVPVLAAGIPTLMEAREGKDLVVTPRELDSVIAHGAALLGSASNRALQPRRSIAQLCWLAG